MRSAQEILREVVGLNKRRTGEGLTPLEYQRWLDVSAQLRKAFPNHPPLGRGETCLRIEYRDLEDLHSWVMLNIHPIGIFVNTPFAPEVGSRFRILATIKETGKQYESWVEVVSNNVGPDYSTAHLGMGLRFTRSSCELRSLLDELCAN